jgi:ABC-type sulfate transport system permease component
MFAGSLQHVTQTLPLAIYAEFDRNFDATLAMSGVLVLISIILLLGLRIGLTLTWQGSSSKRSLFLFGPSASG